MFWQYCGLKCGQGYWAGGEINFYAHSLYWLVRHAGLTDVTAEFLKDGEPIIYGRLTWDELKGLVKNGIIINLRRYSWGVSWTFKEQSVGAEDDFSGFPAWRESLLMDSTNILPRRRSHIDACFYLI